MKTSEFFMGIAFGILSMKAVEIITSLKEDDDQTLLELDTVLTIQNDLKIMHVMAKTEERKQELKRIYEIVFNKINHDKSN